MKKKNPEKLEIEAFVGGPNISCNGFNENYTLKKCLKTIFLICEEKKLDFNIFSTACYYFISIEFLVFHVFLFKAFLLHLFLL